MEDYLIKELSILHETQIQSISEVFVQLNITQKIHKVYFLCESEHIRIIKYNDLMTISILPYEEIFRLVLDSITANFLIIEVR